MKTYSTTKRLPIIAGMQFNGGSTKTIKNKLQIVGYKWVKFIFDSPAKDCLINEFETKRIFI